MKIITIAGTRPELIRLSIIIKKLDVIFDNILIYTNQNYDKNLSTIFFEDLEIRKPDYYFQSQSSLGTFLGNSIIEFEKILITEKPDKILVLGDTNSGLLSILSNKYNIPVYHMEAGNRCYNNNVPEETNRQIIDHVSTFNLPYTENSKFNLLSEGFNRNFVLKTGNPINEVLINYRIKIDNSKILEKLELFDEYILVTCHRAENVDDENVLRNILNSLNEMAKKYKIIFSVHPRTKSKIKNINIKLNDNILLSEPFGFFDFVKLEKNAKMIITDSGTVQEESAIFNIPTIVIRDSTERQELIECGSSILCGTKYDKIISVYQTILKSNLKKNLVLPTDYTILNVSDIVINILS
jgi:UDP-N-acetylglucosamine 2-epimerase (non-hydrolysing)